MKQLHKLLKKYRCLSVSVKAALWFTICSIIQKGISFITVPIFTRLFTVEEYGVYSVYNSWLSLFTIISTFRIYSGSYFKGLYKFRDQKESLTSSLQSLETFMTVIVFSVLLAFRRIISPLLGIPSLLIILMMLRIFVTPPIEFWMTEQRVAYKYKNLVFLTLCIAILNPLLGIIGICATKSHHVEMRVLGGLVVYLIFGIFFYVQNLKKGKTIYNREYWSFAFRYDGPLLPHNLALSILGQSDRIMINSIVGASAAAIYSLAYSVSMTLQIVKDAIRDAMMPWIYSKLQSKEYDDIRETVNVVLVGVSLISFLFIAFAPEVIAIMGSKEYADAILVMPPVVMSLFFAFLYNIFSSIEFYYEKTKYAMVASVSSAALNIILNLIFIPLIGYVAAAYTTLFCYISLAGFHYFMAKKVLLNVGEKFTMVNSRFILSYSILVLVITLVFAIVYRYPVLRYTIIISLGIIFAANRKKISLLVKKLKSAKK